MSVCILLVRIEDPYPPGCLDVEEIQYCACDHILVSGS